MHLFSCGKWLGECKLHLGALFVCLWKCVCAWVQVCMPHILWSSLESLQRERESSSHLVAMAKGDMGDYMCIPVLIWCQTERGQCWGQAGPGSGLWLIILFVCWCVCGKKKKKRERGRERTRQENRACWVFLFWIIEASGIHYMMFWVLKVVDFLNRVFNIFKVLLIGFGYSGTEAQAGKITLTYYYL